MKTLILLCFAVTSAHAAAHVSVPSILSFASWKKQRIDQAKMVHEQLLELRRSKLELTREEELRLRRARMKLLMMEELSPTDYLQQYLVRNYPNNFKVLESAAAKMRPAEVAEIMRAYTNLINARPEVEAAQESAPLFRAPDLGPPRN
jgi:hypothetical protein